jgi:hypothetical protein
MLVQTYQYADYYSGIPVCWFLLWHTSRLYDTFLGGLRQYQYADYFFGVPVRWCLFWHTSTQVLLIKVAYKYAGHDAIGVLVHLLLHRCRSVY